MSFLAKGQESTPQKKSYTTTGGELIFSWAEATQGGLDANVITRFSPVLNIQIQAHRDFSKQFGLFSGINIRNVGYIWDDPTAVNTRYKARSYTLGIPLALKLGKMEGFYLFGGYEIEFPFNFKEKKFVNEDKVEKNTSWFSSKTPTLYQSFLAGIQTPYGTQIKFKYYITNFFNKDYTAQDSNGNSFKPYESIDANVFYVSLSFQFLKGRKSYYSEKKS
jgi:hypothetical protein